MRRTGSIAAVIAMVLNLSSLGSVARAVLPGGDGIIAYGTLSPVSRVYTIGADGSNGAAVTPTDWFAGSPAWSPDGQRIAFVRTRPDGSAGALVTADPDGSHQAVVVPFLAGRNLDSPSWSPSGSAIAFCALRRRGEVVSTVNTNGTSLTKLTIGLHEDCDPSWSPDGTSIAIDTHLPGSKASRIVALNLDGTVRSVIVRSGINYFPDWSPDGSHLVLSRFVRRPGTKFGFYDLFTVKADGTQLRDITRTPNRSEWTPAYSPSGTRIVYSREQGPSTFVPDDLWIIGANGTAPPRRLTDTPRYDEYNPSWQPT